MHIINIFSPKGTNNLTGWINKNACIVISMGDNPLHHVVIGHNSWPRENFVKFRCFNINQVVDIWFIFVSEIPLLEEGINFAPLHTIVHSHLECSIKETCWIGVRFDVVFIIILSSFFSSTSHFVFMNSYK